MFSHVFCYFPPVVINLVCWGRLEQAAGNPAAVTLAAGITAACYVVTGAEWHHMRGARQQESRQTGFRQQESQQQRSRQQDSRKLAMWCQEPGGTTLLDFSRSHGSGNHGSRSQ